MKNPATKNPANRVNVLATYRNEGERDNVGDTTTLLDPDIVDEIKAGAL